MRLICCLMDLTAIDSKQKCCIFHRSFPSYLLFVLFTSVKFYNSVIVSWILMLIFVLIFCLSEDIEDKDS